MDHVGTAKLTITRIWTPQAVYCASPGGSLGLPAPPGDWLCLGFTPSQQPYTHIANCGKKLKNATQFLHRLETVVSLR
jgi:hypothetical protein